MSNVVVPQLGESVNEARVARWLKHEGDHVETGEPLVELETDKIDLEVGADHAGVLSSIKHREGDDVKVGEVLAVVEDGAEASRSSPKTASGSENATPTDAGPRPVSPPKSAATLTPTNADAAPSQTKATASPNPPRAAAESRRATPTGLKIDREHDVDVGPPPITASPATEDRREERVRMSKRRQTIARRLVEAQRTAAMLTTFNEVDMTAVMLLRERRKEAFKQQHGVSIGITSFFVKAAVAALRAFPELNAEIQGDEIVYKHYCDIGIAVGAEGGLVVPVLRNADRMSFAQIELAIRDFATRAADGTLTLEDLTGGTFTITNGGVFGSLMSTPILNPPQVGILGLHKVQERAVPLNGQVVIRPMMYLALSYDHRLVDGREAVQFLVRVKELVEDPGSLLLVS
ncbi:MAG TPA: 2-oxoglutarate dehydrogenase complex dihydrolipoyllysine-residue succinyltransferase [Vicinamibacterales bacterium]|nr:2-oxoglutarate dehydrogenase complex dihydrolipoyllysine-residue succinyltransferase [Vicinamibacterales bacterium]